MGQQKIKISIVNLDVMQWLDGEKSVIEQTVDYAFSTRETNQQNTDLKRYTTVNFWLCHIKNLGVVILMAIVQNVLYHSKDLSLF